MLTINEMEILKSALEGDIGRQKTYLEKLAEQGGSDVRFELWLDETERLLKKVSLKLSGMGHTMYELGDIILISRGQRTRFFEVIKVESEFVWVSDGHVQITKMFKDVELICKAKDRKDKKVPVMKYFK